MRRLRLFVAIVGLLGVSLAPAATRAGEPLKVGNTEAVIYGGPYDYVDPSQSDGEGSTGQEDDAAWSIDIANDPDWTFKDSRSISGSTPTGISYSQKISADAGFHFDRDGSGLTTGATAYATLSSTMTNVGEMSVDLLYTVPFRLGPGATAHVAGNASADATSKGQGEAGASFVVTIRCGPSSAELRFDASSSEGSTQPATGTPAVDKDIDTGDGDCRLEVSAESSAEKAASGLIERGHQAASSLRFDIELIAAPATCDFAGRVYDGNLGGDGHADPLPGLPIVLLKDDVASTSKTVTDKDGKYCLSRVGTLDFDASTYTIQAALVDAAHTPSVFKTLHAGSSADVTAAASLNRTDLGHGDIDIAFTGPDRPWLDDVAASHRDSARFVGWLLSAGVITEAELGTFTVLTGDATTESSFYDSETSTVHIKQAVTPYESRETAASLCPDNCEWHEIGHRVFTQLGIADIHDPRCIGRVAPHGGWRNAGTCDTVQEALPTFLAVVASLTLDAKRGKGYATSDYGGFLNVEDNGWVPWFLFKSDRFGVEGREDFALAELLWDLVDDTPAETAFIGRPSPATAVPITDTISIDAVKLVRLLAEKKAYTAVDIYRALAGSPLLDADVKIPSVDLTADGKPDVGPLDALFLAQDFHPVPDLKTPWYEIGDPVGATNRQPVDPATGEPKLSLPGATEARATVDELHGAGVELTNGAETEATYTIKLGYPSTSSEFDVAVRPRSSTVIHLEVPPYWQGFLGATADLPACGAAGERLVTIEISGPGLAPKTLDSCTYLHAARAATGDVAVTYGTPIPAGPAASAEPGAPAASGGIAAPVVAVIAAVAVAVVAALAWFGRRRKPAA
jgi:hypothetical protein